MMWYEIVLVLAMFIYAIVKIADYVKKEIDWGGLG